MATKAKTTKKAKGSKAAKTATAKATKPAAKRSKANKSTKGATGGTKPKASIPKPSETKRVSALDAAARVLEKSDKPMRSRELINAMAEQGLWTSPGGKTPWATLYSAMIREIDDKGKDSRFKRVDRGTVAVVGVHVWMLQRYGWCFAITVAAATTVAVGRWWWKEVESVRQAEAAERRCERERVAEARRSEEDRRQVARVDGGEPNRLIVALADIISAKALAISAGIVVRVTDQS